MGKSSHTCACKAEQKNITLKPQMGEEEEGEGEEGGKRGGHSSEGRCCFAWGAAG